MTKCVMRQFCNLNEIFRCRSDECCFLRANRVYWSGQVVSMDDKQSKNTRILSIYQRLSSGKMINKAEEAARFGVDERSIQRDIDDIRAFLDDQAMTDGDTRQIAYDRKRKAFLMEGFQSPLMTNGEILAVSKILLESRAFTKEEMSVIIDKLIAGCVPQKNMKLVSDLLANEKFHYVELTNPAGILEKLWDIGNDIKDRHLMEITYHRQGSTQEPVKRIIEPISIIFSEYYFYLNAYIVEKDDADEYRHKYDYPAIFRVDRVDSYRLLDKKFSLPYADRFQEGEFRKRVQFMYPGRLQQIRFRYMGKSIDSILDRLPTARVFAQDETGYTIQAEVYGKGIIMWLMMQGELVEVLSPQKLREDMRNTLSKTLSHYDG